MYGAYTFLLRYAGTDAAVSELVYEMHLKCIGHNALAGSNPARSTFKFN